MRLEPVSFLQLLLLCHLSPAVRARAFPLHALTDPNNGTGAGHQNVPSYDEILRRGSDMSSVHGLPHLLHGVFKQVYSFQPPLPIASFAKFFWDAAQAYHNDNVPGRRCQRFSYGSLEMEVMAISKYTVNGKVEIVQEIVLKEFMEAAALWLYDSAQKGWTDFFEAWVVDEAIKNTVFYIHVANSWDSWKWKPLEFW